MFFYKQMNALVVEDILMNTVLNKREDKSPFISIHIIDL